MHLINQNIKSIIKLCKKYKVTNLWLFGSILTDRFNEKSDIDILVDFDKTKIPLLDRADIFFGFLEELEDNIGRKIDLVEYSAIKNQFFKAEVDKTKELLWTN